LASSVKSAKEEEAEPRHRVISNSNVKFEIIEPIALIDLITPLTCIVGRRSSLILQGVAEENEEHFAWQANTDTPVLFEARIALNPRFLPNIPVDCPHTPILQAKPSG
jgi:hypothetical protein